MQGLSGSVTSWPGPPSHPGLDSTVAQYCPLWAPTTPSQTSQWVTHLGNALAPFSFNFEVLTKPEASELPKGLVLGRDENIYIRLIGSTPLGRCGMSQSTPLGARRPHRHTSG
ncbi:hypothetical protein DVH24_021111 [Malus domestica]|uniref:Uncharacterized protein n=1 Tax=Malus domestica TaxID=3750 RepID=A0A498J8S6_MALDO|nr:hypothetical protein DVH24_021111 [Malus domestica]